MPGAATADETVTPPEAITAAIAPEVLATVAAVAAATRGSAAAARAAMTPMAAPAPASASASAAAARSGGHILPGGSCVKEGEGAIGASDTSRALRAVRSAMHLSRTAGRMGGDFTPPPSMRLPASARRSARLSRTAGHVVSPHGLLFRASPGHAAAAAMIELAAGPAAEDGDRALRDAPSAGVLASGMRKRMTRAAAALAAASSRTDAGM